MPNAQPEQQLSAKFLPPSLYTMANEKQSINLARKESLPKNYSGAKSSFSMSSPLPYQRELPQRPVRVHEHLRRDSAIIIF